MGGFFFYLHWDINSYILKMIFDHCGWVSESSLVSAVFQR